MTLHSYLTRLIWVCVLPMLLLVIVLAALRLAHLQDEDVREAASLAKNVVLTVDQHLGAHTPRQSAATSPTSHDALPPATGQQLQSLLDQLALHDDWAITLLDGQGETLARRAPPGMVADAPTNSPRRFVEKSAVSPWSVVVEISAWEARAPLLKASAALAAGIVIAVLTTLLGGKWASRRLKKAVASLGEFPVANVATKESKTDIAEMSAVHSVLRESLEKREKADTQRRESEQLFRAIFEQAAVGISIVAPDGRWLLANRKLCDITGYALDELLCKKYQDITHPDDLEADVSLAQQLLSGEIENYSIEKRYIRKDGTVCWINITSTLAWQPEGNPDYFISVIEDINATKQAKEKLRVSDIALSSMSQGVLITGPDGLILSANAAFTFITGYDEADIRGQTCDFIKGPLTDANAVESIHLAMVNGAEFSGVILNYRKGGLAFWNELSTTPVRNEHGELTHFICLFRDVTERKLAEGELALHRENLEQLVRTRTAELDIAKTSADSANQAKTDFLATMSHELRTPLNAVIGLTELLTDSPLNRRQRDYADKIQSSAQALRALIDDILDFSKIEAGELHLEHAPFSLDAILRTTASVMGVGMHSKAVEVLFEVEPDIPDELVGDALRLQQILLNLTGNAVKFTESGAIVVSVRCLSRDAAHVMLQFVIRDTGIGIPSEQLGPIFDVFNQATPPTSRLYGGIGLGLSISARLAHLLGGQISVDSAVSWGSEFRLKVPLTLAPVDANAVPPDLPPALRILIIDDQSVARTSLARTCSGFGWHATTADSGAAGLEELRRSAAEGNDYDLMLLDWRMPGMDGLEMLRQAYNAPDVGLAPVVLMVGAFELEQAVGASDDVYLDGIVAKPITPASLREAVSRAYAGEFVAAQPHALKKDQRLSGMRLLVAEDNALNQELIQQVLTRSGAEVVMVDNGLAAVSALRLLDKHFDAVLMDIQMPVMDGYTAARIIRDELGLVDLPIIAVTAFARPQDREKSRLAGMVGHIVKPFNVEDLLDLVAKERRGFVDLPAGPRTASAVQLPGLNVDAAMETFGGDAQRYQELLQKFIVQHSGDVENAHRLFHAEDAQGAQNLLHGLSGVANLLQATELARLASTAENTLMHGDLQAMPMLFDALQVAMRTLVQSIERLSALTPTA